MRYLPALRIEPREMQEAQFLHGKRDGSAENSNAILDASLKVDRRGLFKILCRAGNLADSKTEHDRLGNHLIVENEVVRILEERQRLKQFARECAEARVVFRKLDSEKDILERGEKAVGDVFIEGHSAP